MPDEQWCANEVVRMREAMKDRFGASYQGVVQPAMEKLRQRSQKDSIPLLTAFEREITPLFGGNLLPIQILSAAVVEIYLNGMVNEILGGPR